MLQPANVSTPEAAFFGLAVQVRVAPPGVVIARVIKVVAVVTVLPPASWTVTVGWVAQAVPPVPPPGCAVKTSLLAAPTVMSNELLVAPVRGLLVAASLEPVPAWS